MAKIPTGLSLFVFVGDTPITLSTATWKNNVKVLYQLNTGRTGWINFKPNIDFPTVTQLEKDVFYIIDSYAEFELPGAQFAAGSTGEVAVTQNRLFENSRYVQRNGYFETDVFAYTQDITTATSVEVSFWNAASEVPCEIAVYENFGSGDVYKTTITSQTQGQNDKAVALSAGSKTVKMVVGGQQRPNVELPPAGTFLMGKKYNQSATPLLVFKKATLIIVIGNSISVGIGTGSPVRESLIIRLREQPEFANCDIVGVGCYGYRGWTRDISKYMADEVSRVAAIANGYQSVKIITELAINDYLFSGKTADEIATVYSSYITNVQAAVPNAIIHLQTPFLTRSDNATIDALRLALKNAATAKGITKILDGKTMDFTANNYSGDGLHPNADAVSTVIIPIWKQFLNGSVTAPIPVLAFSQPGSIAVGDADQTLTATSTNNVTPIQFSSSNPAVATIVNGKLHAVAAGTVTITASQAAGNGYAATSINRTVTITVNGNALEFVMIYDVTLVESSSYQSGSSGQSDAFSPYFLPAGVNGSISFAVTSGTTNGVLGLSTGNVREPSYGTFKAGVYGFAGKACYIKSGQTVDTTVPLVQGDILSIVINKSGGNANISYQKNGVEYGTHSMPDQDLYAKMNFLQPNLRINNVQQTGLTKASDLNFTMSNVIKETFTSNTYRATDFGGNAYSSLYLPIGINGSISQTLTASADHGVLALGTGNVQEPNYTTLVAGIHTFQNKISHINQGTVDNTAVTFISGDVLTLFVTKSGGNATIAFKKNGVDIDATLVIPDQKLYLKLWFNGPDLLVSNIQYTGLIS
jgi:hypothetical protein